MLQFPTKDLRVNADKIKQHRHLEVHHLLKKVLLLPPKEQTRNNYGKFSGAGNSEFFWLLIRGLMYPTLRLQDPCSVWTSCMGLNESRLSFQ